MVIIIIGVILFNLGKGHNIIFENKSILINSKQYQPVSNLRVTVNKKGKPIPVKSGYMNKTQLTGNNLNLSIEVLDSNNKVSQTIEKNIKLGMENDYLISMPALLDDNQEAVQEYIEERNE